MRALRYYGPGDVRLEDIAEPLVGNNQVKIKVAWNGICSSDLIIYHHHSPRVPTLTEPHPVTKETLPIVLGHELSGTIVAQGSDVDSYRLPLGQNVVVDPVLPCQRSSCIACSEGHLNLCPHAAFIGIAGGGGGLAEFIAVDQHLVHPLPPSVPLDVGTFVEPLSDAWHTVKQSKLKAGDTVLIIGGGPVGLMILKVAKALGASWVALSEPATKRRDMAKLCGSDVVFDPTSGTDIPAAVHAATGGRGVDVVFECVGTQSTLDIALKAVCAKGVITNVAFWRDKAIVDMGLLMDKEISLLTTFSQNRDLREVLQAVADGKITGLDVLITRRIPFEDFIEKGIKALINEKGDHVKILVHPGK